MIKLLKLIDQGIEKGSSVILVLSIFLMLTFSVLTIVLRWVDISYPWFDSFVRHLVLLATFLGGVLATGRGTHIGIDILSKYLESKKLDHYKIWVNRIINLACLCTLAWLAKACWAFMKIELEFPQEGFLGINSGFLVGIIPVGFGIISYRFFYRLVASFSNQGEVA